MKKNLTSLIGALVALTLLAAACGGSDGDSASSADQAVIDAIAEQMRAEGDVPEAVDVDCMASAMVTGLGGADALAENYGLTLEAINNGESPEDLELPRDEAIALADDVVDCGLGSVMVDEITAGSGLGEDDAKCLLDNLDQDLVRDMMAVGFMNEADGAAVEAAAEGELFGSIFEAFTECNIDPASLG